MSKETMLATALSIKESEARYVIENSGGDFLSLVKNGLPELSLCDELKEQINALLEILNEIKREERNYLSRDEMSSSYILGKYCTTLCGDSDQEEFWVLFFDGLNQLLKTKMLHKGTPKQSLVSVSMIMKEALLCNADKMAVCHNHPSGCLKPSLEDIEMTKAIIDAGRLMNIHLNDHMIVSHGEFLSLREYGYI